MKKHSIPAIAATLLALSIASCGQRNTDSAVKSDTLPEAEAEIYRTFGESYFNALPDLIEKFPESISYDFSLLRDSTDLAISTSDDGRLRFYSFDTHTGGTMIAFQTLIQWLDENGKQHLDTFHYPVEGANPSSIIDRTEGLDDVATISGVHLLPSANGEPATYLVEAYMREWSTMGFYSLMAVQIRDGKPVALPAMKGENGPDTSLSYEINIPYWYFTTDGLGWSWLNEFDKTTGHLYVPEFSEDDYTQPTDRYTVYIWKNGMLVPVAENEPNRRLDPSLADYMSLHEILSTPRHDIRIDRVAPGRYRYASWPKDSLMHGKPAATAFADGVVPDETTPMDFRTPDGYTYRLTRDESKTLTILRNGKPLQTLPIN